MTIEPILKWAGGKRWLARSHTWLFPNSFERYLEPFLGGASVFLALEPQTAILSDLNKHLINLYAAIRDQHIEVERFLSEFASLHNEKFYYETRKQKGDNASKEAARFLYLNRTCWNGLYRVNLKGEFNVPRGTKNKIVLETDNFYKLSEKLKNASLDCCDFSKTIKKSTAGDFLFIDPPYTVAHNNNGFLKYNEQIFSWADQIRLRDEAVLAAERGVRVLVLNACHTSLQKLYEAHGTLHKIRRHSVISGTSTARKPIEELAVQLGYSTQPLVLESVPEEKKKPQAPNYGSHPY